MRPAQTAISAGTDEIRRQMKLGAPDNARYLTAGMNVRHSMPPVQLRPKRREPRVVKRNALRRGPEGDRQRLDAERAVEFGERRLDVRQRQHGEGEQARRRLGQ